MSSLNRDEVARVAALARIDLSPADIDRFANELALVVDAVATVSQFVTADIEATSHPLPATNVWRADEVGPTLDRAAVLAAAPAAAEGKFLVPQILGEE